MIQNERQTPLVNYPVSDDLMLLIVAKNRNDRAGTVYLNHNDSMTRFGDYEPPADWLLEQDAQPVEEKPPPEAGAASSPHTRLSSRRRKKTTADGCRFRAIGS